MSRYRQHYYPYSIETYHRPCLLRRAWRGLRRWLRAL
jgi:hypothetical protein